MREKHGSALTGKKSRLYQTWIDMKQRCHNPKHKSFKTYGARGIKVCEEWKNSFITFSKWAVLSGYNDTLTVDRIDHNSGYSSNNCRWVTKSENTSRTRRNRFIEVYGEKMTCSEASRKFNVLKPTLKQRLNAGMTPEDAIERKPHKGKSINSNVTRRRKPQFSAPSDKEPDVYTQLKVLSERLEKAEADISKLNTEIEHLRKWLGWKLLCIVPPPDAPPK